MNKDFEKEYKKLIEEDPPKLWDRIEKMVNAAIAEGSTAEAEDTAEAEKELVAAETVTESAVEAEEKKEEQPETDTKDKTEASSDPEKNEEEKSGEEEKEEDADRKPLIYGAFGGAAAEKAASEKEDSGEKASEKENSGKKKKVINWQRWILPAAALLCVAIMIPVVIHVNNSRTKNAAEATSASIQSDNKHYAKAEMSESAMGAMDMAEAASDSAGDDSNGRRDYAVPQNSESSATEPIEEGKQVFAGDVVESEEEGEDESWDEEEEDIDEDDEEYDEEEEFEDELIKAIIYIAIDEEEATSALIDQIAAQYGLSRMSYDEDMEEYLLDCPKAMTEEELDELCASIEENENVWYATWDYVEE